VVIDGYRQLRSALEGGAHIVEVFAAPELYLGGDDEALVRMAEALGARVYELGREAFLSIGLGVRPEGLLAVVEKPPTRIRGLAVRPGALVVVADGIERPGNLGTLVRTACAAGVDAVVVSDARTDPFHAEAVQAAVGALFHVPLAVAAAADALGWVRSVGARVVVATPEAERLYSAATYGGATGVVVGNERYGVSRMWRDAADAFVSIPMASGDSLNVAVAAGVILFEATRQRARTAMSRCQAPGHGSTGHARAEVPAHGPNRW
jgi:RNA methyltransferase, TrmH family